MNSVLRLLGLGIIQNIQTAFGLDVFADLKLCDIADTLTNDGKLLAAVKPKIVTVVATAGIGAMKALKASLPDTEVLAVMARTGLTDVDCQAMYGAHLNVENIMRQLVVCVMAGNADGFSVPLKRCSCCVLCIQT